MSELTLKDINKAMRSIDLCMMTTKTSAGALESRPMSNNSNVDWDGDSWFFAYDDCSAAQEIKADEAVNLAFTHTGFMSKPFFISAIGKGELVKDRAEMEKRWDKDVEIWFKDGLDTPGLVMIHVKAERLKYWHGEENGEIAL